MFAPGDEVVCVDDAPRIPERSWSGTIKKGTVYTVAGLTTPPPYHPDHGQVGLVIDGAPNTCAVYGVELGYPPDRFRKVQRRDLTEWLSTATDFEEPKRAPAKRRERA